MPLGVLDTIKKNLSTTVNKIKLKKGENCARYQGKLIHLKWKNKKDVNMLSTIYNEEMQKIVHETYYLHRI